MFGSLQEFLGQLTPHQTHKQNQFNKKTKKKTRNCCSNNIQMFQSIVSHNHMANIFNNKSQIRNHTQILQDATSCCFEGAKATDDRSENYDKIKSSKKKIFLRNVLKYDEYQVESKKELLENYDKYRKIIEQKKEVNNLKSIFDKQQINHEKVRLKNRNYMHLTGKIRHSDHLLRALLRVQKNESKNQNTFFQMSIMNLENKIQKLQKNQNRAKDPFSYNSFKQLLKNESQLQQQTNKLKYTNLKKISVTEPTQVKKSKKHQDRSQKSKLKSNSLQQRKCTSTSIELKICAQQRKATMKTINRLIRKLSATRMVSRQSNNKSVV